MGFMVTPWDGVICSDKLYENCSLSTVHPFSDEFFDLHRRLAVSLSLIGFGLNFLMLYLVRHYSQRIVHIRQLFLVTCAIDLTLSTSNLLVAPYVHISGGHFIGILNLWIRPESDTVISVLACICGALTLCSWGGITMQFVYRFEMIKHGRHLTGRQFRIFVAATIFVLIAMSLTAANLYGRRDEEWRAVAVNILCTSGLSIDPKFIVGGRLNAYPTFIYSVLSSSVALICYSVVIYTEFARRRYFHTSPVSQNTRRMMDSANSAFLALAICPLVANLLPCLYLNTIDRNCHPNIRAIFVANLMIITGPVLNPIAAILLIRPYREGLVNVVVGDKGADLGHSSETAHQSEERSSVQTIGRTSTEVSETLAARSVGVQTN